VPPRHLALVLVALLALAGCGGEQATTNETTATQLPVATVPTDSSKPVRLSATQQARLDRVTKSFISSSTVFLNTLNRCAQARSRANCVRTAVTAAQKSVTATRRSLRRLRNDVTGTCAEQIDAVIVKLGDVTGVLGPMAQAMTVGRIAQIAQLGANAQTELRNFAAATTLPIQQACG